MSKNRFAANCDLNQNQIVGDLRSLGCSVETGHDDLLIACNGLMFWIELKSDNAVSKKTGKIFESKIKPSQKRIRSTWNDTYIIASSLEQIIDAMNKVFKSFDMRQVKIYWDTQRKKKN